MVFTWYKTKQLLLLLLILLKNNLKTYTRDDYQSRLPLNCFTRIIMHYNCKIIAFIMFELLKHLMTVYKLYFIR